MLSAALALPAMAAPIMAAAPAELGAARSPYANFLIGRYAIANGIACNVEIKPCPGREAETGDAVARLARQFWSGVHKRPLLSSFSEEALASAQAAAPELPRALLVEAVPDDWPARLRKYGCIGLNINQKDATPELIGAVHRAGHRIAAWTVNDPDRARLLFSWGIDAVFTDQLSLIAPTA